MFANPLWSAAIFVVLGLMYFIIRTKHGGPLLAPYRHIEGWKDWLLVVAYDFRSWVASIVAGVAIAAPDLVVAILPVDLTFLVGDRYATIVTGILTAYLALNRAWSTTPPAERDA